MPCEPQKRARLPWRAAASAGGPREPRAAVCSRDSHVGTIGLTSSFLHRGGRDSFQSSSRGYPQWSSRKGCAGPISQPHGHRECRRSPLPRQHTTGHADQARDPSSDLHGQVDRPVHDRTAPIYRPSQHDPHLRRRRRLQPVSRSGSSRSHSSRRLIRAPRQRQVTPTPTRSPVWLACSLRIISRPAPPSCST